MSISIFQSPLQLTPVNAYHTYSVGSTLSGNTDFRYVADIWLNPFQTTAVKVARLRIQPNTSGRGVFNIEQILQSYIRGNIRSETPQIVSGSSVTPSFNPNGFIPNISGVSFSNQFNLDPQYQTLLHIADYRVIFGEQYTNISGTTTLDIPTDPSLPLSSFSASLTLSFASYGGDPNTVNWTGVDSNILNYGTTTAQGWTYSHTTSVGGFIASGSGLSSSSSYTPTLAPSLGDVVIVTEIYSGQQYRATWFIEPGFTGFTGVFIRANNASNSLTQPDSITIYPGVQNNKTNFNYNGVLNSQSTNPDGSNNFRFYQGYKFQNSSVRNTNQPGQFLSIFGNDTRLESFNSYLTTPAFNAPVRHRNHHYKCPLLISGFWTNVGTYTNNITGLTVGGSSTITGANSFVDYIPFNNAINPNLKQDPTFRIYYANLQPYISKNNLQKLAVWGTTSASSPYNYTGNSKTEAVVYDVYGDDCLSDPIHFVWLSSNGSFDSYTFDRKNVRSLSAGRKTYAQGGVRDNSVFNPFDYQPRKVIYDTDYMEQVTAQSTWVDENDTNIIEDMFSSSQVWLIKDYDYVFNGTPQNITPYLIPVVVTNNTFDEYKERYNKVFQYTFTFEYNPFQTYRTTL